MSQLLIDADLVAYRFACVNTQKLDWGGGVKTEKTNPDGARRDVDNFIHWLTQQTGDDEYLCVLSGGENFRKHLLPDYKVQRPPKPELLQITRNQIIENHPCHVTDGIEADDYLGILQTYSFANGFPNDETTIASEDKDLLQIPGWNYNWRKKRMREVSLQEANWWFWMQVLQGDVTDGYKGCPGVGPKTADKLVKWCSSTDEAWPIIVETYAKKGLDEDYALAQARMARILRATDYDFNKKEMKLWTPPAHA